MPRALNLSGQTFGKLTVLHRVKLPNSGGWMVRCECGAEKTVRTKDLTIGGTVSCGCHRRRRMVELNTKHGAFGTREYIAWSAAKGRCFNPNDKSRVHYGARGITMCDAWSASFEAFLADMGPCPPGYTLERKDVNGNYEPDNCCWIPAADQSKNRRVVIEARQRRERARAP